jgi:very-short-patch-repair endonuclease
VARTCLDLARAGRDPDPEDLLRRRLMTVDQLQRSLSRSRGRRGQRAAVALVADLVDGPWSRGETLAHRHLRAAGVTGWVGNLSLIIRGQRHVIDVAFEGVKLAVEIDGFSVHRTAADRARDLARQNALVEAGWTVLRFTWDDLQDADRFVATVLRVLRRLPAAAG